MLEPRLCADDPVTPIARTCRTRLRTRVVTLAGEANVASVYAGPHLSLPHAEIEFLRDVVGDARIVALWARGHPWRSRLLRDEGAHPSVPGRGDGIQHVRHRGDLARIAASRPLRAHRRREIPGEIPVGALFLDLEHRVRAGNDRMDARTQRGRGRPVGFHGFDMQYPGMALHNVREYVRARGARGIAEAVSALLDCLDSVMRTAPDGRRTSASRELPGFSPSSYRTPTWQPHRSTKLRDLPALRSRDDVRRPSAGEDAFEDRASRACASRCSTT